MSTLPLIITLPKWPKLLSYLESRGIPVLTGYITHRDRHVIAEELSRIANIPIDSSKESMFIYSISTEYINSPEATLFLLRYA